MFSKSLGFLIAATAIASASAQSYDIGCIYPPEAPRDPVEGRNKITFAFLQFSGSRETPYVIHGSHEITSCSAMCLSYHTPGMKDPLTLEERRFGVPEWGQNPWSIVMCYAQCSMYVEAALTPDGIDYFTTLSEQGYELEYPSERQDIKDAINSCGPRDTCSTGCKDICDLIIGSGYHPYMMGHYIGNKVKQYFDTDGWNRQGDMQYDVETDSAVPCTGSCRIFQDTTGYTPRPDPRKYPELNNDAKYECTGDCRRWQPLQEGDVFGSLREQEFVAPHIGTMAHTILRAPTLTLENPDYDLYTQSLDVIEQVKMTSSDDYKKDAIGLFDNKLKVRAIIQQAVLAQFYDNGEMPFEKYIMYLMSMSTAEHDAVIQAWHEKVHHDLVRPTTVIKSWGSDMLNTYGGVRNFDGPKDIAARDFEAFIRVMPHGEFPSGSSCLCTSYQEFTDNFLLREYNRTIVDIYSREIEQTYDDMTHLKDICGESRIWGGMHYPEAIPAGEEICSGLGDLAIDWYDEVMDDADVSMFTYKGTPVPTCSER